LPSGTRGGSRMPELGLSGSVRGVRGDMHPYRDQRPQRTSSPFVSLRALRAFVVKSIRPSSVGAQENLCLAVTARPAEPAARRTPRRPHRPSA
jgi:hypothetical protein